VSGPAARPGPIPWASPVDFAAHGESAGWAKPTAKDDGRFVRAEYPFKGRIDPDGPFQPAPGRYVLYISWACPWAHRQAIVRQLKGLQDVVGLAVVDPLRDGRGWAFRPGQHLTGDPYNHFTLLRQAYDATRPGYSGHISVPVLWDCQTKVVVSNHFPDISLDLGSQFDAWADHGELDLYPADLRWSIDAINQRVYRDVNNGVYRCGFARGQAAYDEAVQALFETLDWLEERLRDRVYLLGDRLTEADVRLYPTLARFDSVYVTHFKTNLRRLVDYPNLWDYTRFLYQQPAFGGTTFFDQIKRHYFVTHPHLNPTRVVPVGPQLDWLAPTRRGG
jgi:putative glutathione S-transferase